MREVGAFLRAAKWKRDFEMMDSGSPTPACSFHFFEWSIRPFVTSDFTQIWADALRADRPAGSSSRIERKSLRRNIARVGKG